MNDTTLDIRMEASALHIHPHCDLVASTVEEIRTQLLSVLEKAPLDIVLNLEEVQEVDSLGITLVVSLFKSCQKLKKKFSITRVSPDILRVFKLCNLHKVFTVEGK